MLRGSLLLYHQNIYIQTVLGRVNYVKCVKTRINNDELEFLFVSSPPVQTSKSLHLSTYVGLSAIQLSLFLIKVWPFCKRNFISWKDSYTKQTSDRNREIPAVQLHQVVQIFLNGPAPAFFRLFRSFLTITIFTTYYPVHGFEPTTS